MLQGAGKISKALAVLFLAASFSGSLLWGQFTSSIEGTITDESGAAIPGATVALLNVSTGIKTAIQSTSVGFYQFPSLPAGIYTLSISAAGFRASEITDLRLEIGDHRTTNVSLQVGAQATSVVVKAESAMVDLAEASISTVIESKMLADLPLAGRSFLALAMTSPGVTGVSVPADVFGGETQVNVNVGGQRGEQNGFSVDSGTVSSMVRHGRTNLQPNAESVQELQVSVNDFSAAHGNDAGGGIRVLTRSGTNVYHGSISWFHQNNVLTSRNIFQSTVNPSTGRALPVSRRNEVAGGFGGPIRKNRTFLFGSFDILRQTIGASGTSTVETPEFVNFVSQKYPNNKSSYLFKNQAASFAPVRNVRTAGSLLGVNCIGSALITSPIGQIPCDLAVLGDGVTPIPSARNPYQWNVRGDHMIGDKDRFYASVFRNADKSNALSIMSRPATIYEYPIWNWYGNVNETHTFSPKLINEFRMTVTRVHGEISCQNMCDIPIISVAGLTGFGLSGPVPFIQNNYEYGDQIVWIHGGHSFKAGFSLSRLQSNWKPTPSYQRPTFNFNNIWDFVNDNPFSETGIGFNPVTGSVYTPDTAERQHTESWFVEDAWKIRPNLTMTFGLRWEAYGKVNQATMGNNVQWLSGTDTRGRIADGKNVTKYNILDNGDWNNFAPRLSIVWDPTGKGTTSIRGGAGIFYDFLPSQLYGGAHFTPPIYMLLTVSPQTAPLLPLYAFGASKTDPFQFPRPAGLQGITGLDNHNGSTYARADITWIDPNLRSSYTISNSLGVQHAVTSTLTVEANFVSNQGRKLYAKYNVNRFPGDLIQNNGVLKRLNPSFGGIDYGQSNLTSSYIGGNISARQRASHGLTVQAAYTFGRALDYADGFGGGLAIQDPWNLNLDRAAAGYNVPQKFAFSALWAVPTTSKPGVLKSITENWQLSGVTILQSGMPFSVTCGLPFAAVRNATGQIVGNSGCDYNADGSNFDRPNTPSFGNVIPMDRQTLLTGVFKPADFPAPALGQVGNLGRNMFTNRGLANIDLSLARLFKLPWVHEKSDLQLRADAFNAFNHVNLGGINSNLSSPTTFGRVTSINGASLPRQFQFGLRFSF
jgi:hypothetical protein